MKKKEMEKYIHELVWNGIKDLSHVQHRIYFNKKLELQDAEIEKSSYLYITIFDSFNEEGQDRYFGSDTERKTNSFMETDYLGSPVTHSDAYFKAQREKDYRIICIKLSDDEGSILHEEQEVLVAIDAKNDQRFFNESNISGGKLKTLYKQDQLLNKLIEGVEKAGEEGGFELGVDTLENLYKMQRDQARQFDLKKPHVNALAADIKDSKGKALDDMKPTILLQDFYGKGVHKRGGNTHTIEACMKPSVKKYVTKSLPTVLVPKELWEQCDKDTIRNFLRWDNKNEDQLSRIYTDNDEIVESCCALMVKYDLSHLDKRVKDLAIKLGGGGARWDKIRPKLRKFSQGLYSKSMLPPGKELIHYTDATLKDIEKKRTTEFSDFITFSTVYSGNSFNGFEVILKWLTNPANDERTLHGGFFHGMDSDQQYQDEWPAKEAVLIPLIKAIFKKCGKENHFISDMLPRFQDKQN